MISDKDINFINMCFDVAKRVDRFKNARIAAALVYKNQVISMGVNQNKTSPFHTRFCDHEDLGVKNKIYMHAETACLSKTRNFVDIKRMRNATLYVARAKRHHSKLPFEYGMCKPCPICCRAINELQIGRVVYTIDHGIIEERT